MEEGVEPTPTSKYPTCVDVFGAFATMTKRQSRETGGVQMVVHDPNAPDPDVTVTGAPLSIIGIIRSPYGLLKVMA